MENTYVGPFLIVKKLGTNRRQRVYHARQTEQDRDVALKFISIPPTVEWSKALDKIDREVKELQKLQHPNLVQVFGAGVDDEQIFFATELVDGESLASILSRRGKLTQDLVVEYGRQIAEVLRYLHSYDLIHSKLTPEKILVTADHKIKIADLRLNRSKRRRWDSTRQRELDIAAYMAPEQFNEGATAKSDFYSLGVILFEMLTGKLPYEPDTMGRMALTKMKAPVPSVASQMINCPAWLDRIISQMLAPDPRKRPHTARAISMAFDEIKKVDATKKAAVSQMSAGFNPLNAGQDKTEARRLLGQKKAKRKPENDVPFYQRIPFQIGALVFIVLVIALFARLPNHRSIVDKAQAMINSDNPQDWAQARSQLKPIADSESELAAEAEALYYQSRRKTIVHQAKLGKSNRLQSKNLKTFLEAARAQESGDLETASQLYSQLVAEVDPDGSDRHFYQEAKSRLDAIQESQALPTDIKQLAELVRATTSAATPKELEDARKLLSKIVLDYAGVEGYGELHVFASKQLESVKQRLEE